MKLTQRHSSISDTRASGLQQIGSSLALAHSAGLVGTLLGKPSRNYYRRLDKPPYSPPGWLFGVVWLFWLRVALLYVFLLAGAFQRPT